MAEPELIIRVAPNQKIQLDEIDPRDKRGLERADAEARFALLQQQISELQELLYAAGTHSLLMVLQGMDTSGKDGTVRKVFGLVDPIGVHAIPFKKPTAEELGHDFLWRVHQHAPERGQIAIFNRSHYEDVLIVRVHNLVPEARWKLRYRQINDFEHLLISHDTILLKFFLHIGAQEQEQRLLEREQDVTKSWKLAVSDWQERQHWDAYQRAYEEVFERCSPKEAPWYIVPAERKWYRNYVIAEQIVATLAPYKAQWMERLAQVGERSKAELDAFRKANA